MLHQIMFGQSDYLTQLSSMIIQYNYDAKFELN